MEWRIFLIIIHGGKIKTTLSIYSGDFIFKISVFNVKNVREIKATLDDKITLLAIPKLSITNPQIKLSLIHI